MKTIENLKTEEVHDFESLVSIMDILRSDGGCPWDREQTHKSIRKCLIEEAYEVLEAIDGDNSELLREELGDLMFQVMFHSRIEKENGRFDVYDVIHDVCSKMIYRHPHVFGTVDAETSEAVSQNWEELKKKEKQYKGVSESLRRVPPSLSAVLKAQKVIGKAKSKLGYTVEKSSVQGDSIAEKMFLLCAEAEDLGIDLEYELNQVTNSFICCVETSKNDLQ